MKSDAVGLHMGYMQIHRIQNAMKINASTVKKVKPPETGYDLHWDSDLKGFGLRVTAAGAKAYIAQAKVNGKARRVTLGRHGTITPDQARKLARVELGDMSRGTDPSVEKARQKAESVTLADVVQAYLANRRTRSGLPLKERTKTDIQYHLKTNFSSWRDKPIAKITREMVQRRYSDLCKRSTAQANQAMRVLSGLMNYAAASYRTPEGERIITDNPVAVLREANMLRAVKGKSSAVPLDRIGEWWGAVQTMRHDPALTTASRAAVDLIALLAVTGLRLGEARAIRWDQVDLTESSLMLSDTKNRSDIRLPLSTVALGIISTRPEGNRYVFPPRSEGGKIPHLKDCRAQLEIIATKTGIQVTAHDLRRTFRAVAAACNVELWRCKALMNHKQNHDVTLAHYTDLSDVRHLKPEADQIGQYFEHHRYIYESNSGCKRERPQA